GSARLQKSAPSPPGELGEGSGQAAATDQGRRQAARQGAGTAQAEGCGRQLNTGATRESWAPRDWISRGRQGILAAFFASALQFRAVKWPVPFEHLYSWSLK